MADDTPSPDAPVTDEQEIVQTVPQTVAFEQANFEHVIKTLKRDANRAKSVELAARDNLARLGVEPDLGQVYTQPLANGNTNTNVFDIVMWMQKITADDHIAIEQLQAIHATAAFVNR